MLGGSYEDQPLYILDCAWCVKTKESIKDSLKELGTKADVEEILIDSDEKAKKYDFGGSPTVIDSMEKKTRDRLMELGKKGDTYDDIINKLADYWEKKKR